MSKNDGGTAFPMQDPQAIHAYAIAKAGAPTEENVHTQEKDYLAARAEAVSGMALLDYFAAKALVGLLSWPGDDGCGSYHSNSDPAHTASMAYEYGKAMLAARVKP